MGSSPTRATIRRVDRIGVRVLSTLSCGYGILTLINRTNHTSYIIEPEHARKWAAYIIKGKLNAESSIPNNSLPHGDPSPT